MKVRRLLGVLSSLHTYIYINIIRGSQRVAHTVYCSLLALVDTQNDAAASNPAEEPTQPAVPTGPSAMLPSILQNGRLVSICFMVSSCCFAGFVDIDPLTLTGCLNICY